MKKLGMLALTFIILLQPLLMPVKVHAAAQTFVSVSQNLNFGYALDSNGQIWAWGNNSFGAYGDGTTITVDDAKRVEVMDNGSPVTFQDVKAGTEHGLALDTDGRLWTTGNDNNLQLGNGSAVGAVHSWTKISATDGGSEVVFEQIAALRFSSYALDENGKLWVFGNFTRVLSEGSEVPIPATRYGIDAESFQRIDGKFDHLLGIDTSGYVWGISNNSNLDPRKYTPTDSGGTDVLFQSVSSGIWFMNTALDEDGQVWIWGNYEAGQLGDGGATNAIRYEPELLPITDGGAPVAIADISAGDTHVLALDEHGDLWAWGNNNGGKLGNGSTVSSNVPIQVVVTDAGGNPVRFTSVAAGDGLSCGIDTEGRIWTWGGGKLVPQLQKSAASVSLTVTPASSSSYLQSVTLTATVSGDGDSPTGTIVFKDGSTTLGSSSLSGGTATWTTSSLSVGSHSLKAEYAGDDFYSAKTSAALSHQVNMPSAPNLTLTPSSTVDSFNPVTVSVAVDINGSGNSLDRLKWLAGNHSAAAFAAAGTDITGPRAFDAANNGTYTVYARDAAGNVTIKTIVIDNVLVAGDATALAGAISDAAQELTDHPQGSGVGEAPAGARSTLQAAIDAAQTVYDDRTNQTQSELDAAVSTLNAAVTAFAGAVNSAGNATALATAITNANQALTDHPEGSGVGEAPASARSTLQAAIDAAQAVYDDRANQTQSELDTAVSTLNAAVSTFTGAVIGVGNATALAGAISDANQALTDHPEGSGVGDAPASARSTLQAAIDAAQAVYDDRANRTQAQLDAAVSTLNAAVTVFAGAVIGAGDAMALAAAISNANQALTDHPEGSGVGEAPASARSTLQAAIDAAQAVYDDRTNQTQSELDAAVSTLNAAVTTFAGAVIGAGDVMALAAAISDANQALTDHPEGSGVGEAPASVRSTLQAAIDAAQAVYDDRTNQTQSELDTATSTLNSAVSTFAGAVIGAGNAMALAGEISDAEQALTDHPEGSGVGDAPASARSTLQAAIDAAQAVYDDRANQTQSELDTATSTLETAIMAFEAAVIGSGNATALATAISNAEQALTDHPEGSGVGEAPASARSALQAAIDAAQAVYDDRANQTQSELDAAVSTLNAAVTAFAGAVIGAGDAMALAAAISDANQALTDHPEGSGVGDAPASARSTLQAAIDAAQAVYDDRLNQSQTELDSATSALNDAIAAFKAVVTGIAITAPSDGLYGLGQTLAFKVTYGYGVTVSGTPEISFEIGGSTVTQVVYAAYSGDRGTELTELSFLYDIPQDLVDVDGIAILSPIGLPDGASIMRTSGGAADLAYELPDTGGVHIVSAAPDLALSSAPDNSTSTQNAVSVTVTASVYGQSAGNTLTELSWMRGSHSAAEFQGGADSSDILGANQFDVTVNGTYSVYAKDAAGNEAVTEITITNIVTRDNGNDDYNDGDDDDQDEDREPGFLITLTADAAMTRTYRLTPEQLEADEIVIDGNLLALSDNPQEWEMKLPVKTLLAWTEANPDGRLILRTGLADYELPSAVLSSLQEESLNAVILRLSTVSGGTLEELEAEVEAIGGQLLGEPLKIGLATIIDGHEQMLATYEQYISVTQKIGTEVQPDNGLVARYHPEANAFSPVPALIQSDAVHWSSRSGGIYAVLSNDKNFADVRDTWFEEAVNRLGSKLIVKGIDETHFAPNDLVTRAELVAMLVRSLGLEPVSDSSKVFTDVRSYAWYAGAVNTAAREGLVHGYENGSFRPAVEISREETVVLLVNAMRYAGMTFADRDQIDLSEFTDAVAISDWAADDMAAAVQSGIIKGDDTQSLNPQDAITRAEAAVMLERMLRAVKFIN
ncbi:S-layer homology domain-containing protein [Paenibacillus sp. J5C_2022]|uniref:S-layer homology domain-containing protein n=1 Tax=Paenibacillus sp. J5C2022 TaxID=2977129 RepID=UPI0021D2F60C|nr:S-layer homology domain-containing protein [Paenibacillus sp. J5C2022]MCU6708872.1 S-layer homology domain-containing protein [Paenibacillus sp. J5C2022]